MSGLRPKHKSRILSCTLLLARMVIITPLMLCALPAAAALGQAGTLADVSSWESEPVTWGRVQAISDDATFLGPLTAHYNMAYGATVLGLNAREGGSTYYGVVANYHDGQVDVLDTIGPLAAPVEWQSGPYHLAAGLDDGRLIAFLTAPGEYPQQVVLSRDYAPRTPVYCVTRPGQPIDDEWGKWTLTAAYQRDLLDPELAILTFDGRGRVLDSAQTLKLPAQLSSVAYLDMPAAGASIPVVGFVTSKGMAAAWHEYAWGWHVETLASVSLGNCRLAPIADPANPGLLAFYLDTSDPFGVSQLQRINLEYYQGEVTIRWGRSSLLAEQLDARSATFVDSVLAPMPLLVAATDSDIRLARLALDDSTPVRQQVIEEVLLYSGERQTGGGNMPLYPILAVAGAAHWRTGYPEIYWIQLGSHFGGSGQLFRLAFQPRQR
jgi:hypothetical protein